MVCQPQYLLFCDSHLTQPVSSDGNCEPLIGQGQWHFVLERLDCQERLEAIDNEPQIHRDRIALLAVIRGLEALEQPGHVRLVTTSRYVDRGMRFGLPNWREANYEWESFGTFKPIRNADLWQRINSAMQFHEISCRMLVANSQISQPYFFRRRGLLARNTADTLGASILTEASGIEALSKTDRQRTGRLVVQPVERAVDETRDPTGLPPVRRTASASALHGTETTVSSRLRTAKRPQTSKRQWWDMATAWIETVNGAKVLAAELSAVPN